MNTQYKTLWTKLKDNGDKANSALFNLHINSIKKISDEQSHTNKQFKKTLTTKIRKFIFRCSNDLL